VSCCNAFAPIGFEHLHAPQVNRPQRVDPSFVRSVGEHHAHLDFLVPDMHCGGCLETVERALAHMPGVVSARANLTSHRVAVDFDPSTASPDDMLSAIDGAGYTARPFDAVALDAAGSDQTGRDLVRSMAVAGFAAGNIMLLSVSVWSGADAATRDLFHWVSALIALPALVYAGRPFFRSAWRALSARSVNMDVPISLGVILAAIMSLYETATHGEHAWFDAAITLLFFLLVGRFLDHRMRDVARSAASKLMSLSARSAMRLAADGTVTHVPISQINVGDVVQIAAGERIPVDGVVLAGRSDIDSAMLTGESDPRPVNEGGPVFAGTLNLTGPLKVSVGERSADTLLAEIMRLMEAAERSDTRFVRLADRAARRYAPAVHVLAAVTLIGWLVAGAGWHAALTACVAVLIITCPCALGLAVPAVQVVASGFLLRRGIMLKDGTALEKLAAVDTVVFDKTGTLTEGKPKLVESPVADVGIWEVAAALGQASRHPLALALADSATTRGIKPATLADIVEQPGCGVEANWHGSRVRLGRREWVGGKAAATDRSARSEIQLAIGNAAPLTFRFQDALREDAAETVRMLKQLGLSVILLSGDREEAVRAAARTAGIDRWQSNYLPTDKAAMLSRLKTAGRRVLMVGDGINDAPALALAGVSMSPASASDISQTAAGIVFTGPRLAPVVTAIRTARAARHTILQNFALAIGYNLIAVPIAMLGHATPLIAAVAMSTSSILVTANALRMPLSLRTGKVKRATAPLLSKEATA
jgi:P-type Cu2+ transporter